MLLRRFANTPSLTRLVRDHIWGCEPLCQSQSGQHQHTGTAQQPEECHRDSGGAEHLLSARLASCGGASTSAPWREPSSPSWAPNPDGHRHLHPSLVFLRGLKVLRRRFQLPEDVQSAVQREMEVAQQKPPPPAVPALAPRPLQISSRRTGCISYKVGMTQEWDEHGVRVPLTVLWIDDCQVVGMKWPELHGYWALQLGAGYSMQNNLHPGQAGLFLKQGVPFKAVMSEFRVSEDALLPVGTHITAAHFVAGQHVDVTGWSKNKGFQGVMKRWNFKGLPATHGVSLAHRSPGSIGNRTSPGKVWKGKKMPGQLGDERCTVHDCLVYKVDAARNLVYVRGQVPGPKGQEVLLRDALNTRHTVRLTWELPHPTYCGAGGAALSDLGRAGVAAALALEEGGSGGGAGVVGEAAQRLLPASVPDIQVFRGNKDPYIPYSKETDYVEYKWEK